MFGVSHISRSLLYSVSFQCRPMCSAARRTSRRSRKSPAAAEPFQEVNERHTGCDITGRQELRLISRRTIGTETRDRSPTALSARSARSRRGGGPQPLSQSSCRASKGLFRSNIGTGGVFSSFTPTHCPPSAESQGEDLPRRNGTPLQEQVASSAPCALARRIVSDHHQHRCPPLFRNTHFAVIMLYTVGKQDENIKNVLLSFFFTVLLRLFGLLRLLSTLI